MLIVALACGERKAAVVPVETRVTNEIARVEQTLKRLDLKKLPAEVREEPKAHLDQVARAKSATATDVRLFRLRNAFVGAEIMTLLAANPAASTDQKKFEESWSGKRALFEQKRSVAAGSLLHRAFEQASVNRAEKYYRASLAYGKASGPFNGAYYLAEGEANLRFRDFVASLPRVESNEPMPRRDSIEAALRRLESEAVSAYGRAPDDRANIVASASLKEARELYAQNLLEGASLALMEARFALSRGKKIEATAAAATSGESIPALFAAIAAEPKNQYAGPIRAEVLPLYTALFAPPPQVRAAPASVTVTLVRWPYT